VETLWENFLGTWENILFERSEHFEENLVSNFYKETMKSIEGSKGFERSRSLVSSGLKSVQYEKFLASIKDLNGDNFTWTYNLIIKHFTEDLCSGNFNRSVEEAVSSYGFLQSITQNSIFARYNQISLQTQRVLVKLICKSVDELFSVNPSSQFF
jgi:hypothetical protein